MSDTHAHTASYVRKDMLPQQTPPLTEIGVLKWVRENLFSSPMNGLLTIVSLYVIYWIAALVGPWMVNGIWDAGSLTECRDTLRIGWEEDLRQLASRIPVDSVEGLALMAIASIGSLTGMSGNELSDVLTAAGIDHPTRPSGACFAVISDRWRQLIFGFYPNDSYWRPILALVVFFIGIAPVLFDRLPRSMLVGSLITPFIMYMLLWGGSIWGPILVGLGFVIGYFAFRLVAPINAILGVIASVMLPILFWLFVMPAVSAALFSIAPIGLEFIESNDFGGFTLSVIIGISAIILSLPLGIVLALARQSDLPIIKYSAVVFIEVIRGIPLIVWLFTASLLLNYFMPPGTNFDLMLRVIIMVTLFSAAYLAEVIRGGLAALPKGQYEAADALGLDYWKAMRLIILPQALKISIPGIVNTFIGLFKDTTLVVFIGLLDPIGLTKSIRNSTDWNGIYWELYIFVGLLFFIFCYGMSRYSLYLEKKLQREHR